MRRPFSFITFSVVILPQLKPRPTTTVRTMCVCVWLSCTRSMCVVDDADDQDTTQQLNWAKREKGRHTWAMGASGWACGGWNRFPARLLLTGREEKWCPIFTLPALTKNSFFRLLLRLSTTINVIKIFYPNGMMIRLKSNQIARLFGQQQESTCGRVLFIERRRNQESAEQSGYHLLCFAYKSSSVVTPCVPHDALTANHATHTHTHNGYIYKKEDESV